MQTAFFTCLTLLLVIVPLPKAALVFGINLEKLSFAFTYISYLFSIFFLFLAVFGRATFGIFQKEFSLIVFILFLFPFTQILQMLYWGYFSLAILKPLAWFLPPILPSLIINPATYTMELNAFAVKIFWPCAGITSMVTFTALYLAALMLLSDDKKIKKGKAFFAWILGLVIIFIINAARLVVLVLIGGYVSKTLALGLFHEYAGAVFFLIIFVFYLRHVIPKIILPKKI